LKQACALAALLRVAPKHALGAHNIDALTVSESVVSFTQLLEAEDSFIASSAAIPLNIF
jgi:hypothetical protein